MLKYKIGPQQRLVIVCHLPCYGTANIMARSDAKSAARRVEILKSAAGAFRRRGYHGASVAEIARALQMTKGNLYYYFRNKEEILFACHQYSLDLLLQVLADVQASPDPADAKLRRLVQAFVHLILDELHGTGLFLDLQALSKSHLRHIVRRRDQFDRGLREILASGMTEGVFAAGDPKLLSFAALGAINWIPKWFDPRGTARSTEIADTFAAFIVSGLKEHAVDARFEAATAPDAGRHFSPAGKDLTRALPPKTRDDSRIAGGPERPRLLRAAHAVRSARGRGGGAPRAPK
jgi:TetR/AcrR family transcriptional regulator